MPELTSTLTVDRVEELMNYFGLQGITVAGENVIACCPFHDDTNPSFAIHPERGANCFVCEKGKFKDPHQCFAAIAKELDIPYNPLTGPELSLEDILAPMDTSSAVDDEPDCDIASLKFYRDDPEHFINSWGITREVVERRKLRIDPLKDGEVFPLLDMMGRYYGVIERIPPEREGYHSIYRYPRKYKRANHLIGEDASFIGTREVWVVEGMRDLCAIESRVPGAKAVALGTNLASAYQKERLKAYDRVILALDNDEAGRRGVDDLLECLPASGSFVALYDGKDPMQASGDFEVVRGVFYDNRPTSRKKGVCLR